MISTAMILAAGFGTRMRPLTDTQPKPLIPVAGRPMLTRILDHLSAAGVSKVVVNSHYLAPLIQKAVPPSVLISHEDTLLETGGGVRNALPLLGKDPFFVLNADDVWTDATVLPALASAWDPQTMDALLLLTPRETCYGYEGKGDFFLSAPHRLTRPDAQTSAPYVYGGLQIVHPRLFKGELPTLFSFNLLWNKAIEEGRLGAYVHQGPWYHIGTPEALHLCEPLIQQAEQKS